MVFSSAIFLFYFLPAFLLLYYVLPWKNAVLLVGSLLFYAWGEPRFVPLLMLSAVFNYAVGTRIARADASRKTWLVWGIGLNLAMLCYYKYLGFFAAIASALLSRQADPLQIVLPLGISFFTFQGISYLIDVYRRDIEAEDSLLRFAMYKAMFPQLIAGPIVRYTQIAGEIEHRHLSNARLWRGFHQFVIGLAQKCLIANPVALAADQLFAVQTPSLDAPAAWMGALCYAIQILFDFGGYSNMAIGLGHMLGFSYPRNFDRPYSALSITEFWRRWHMSLSSWFRDYLYIPLGGNRHGPVRTYFNLALVFLLCGLWHGAAWTFVLWGLWHGFWLVVERAGAGKLLARMPWPLAQAITFALVILGWVLFRAADVPHALGYLGAMFGAYDGSAVLHSWRTDIGGSTALALAVGVVLALWRTGRTGPQAQESKLHEKAQEHTPQAGQPFRVPALLGYAGQGVMTVALSLLCVATLAVGTYNPFIYFRF